MPALVIIVVVLVLVGLFIPVIKGLTDNKAETPPERDVALTLLSEIRGEILAILPQSGLDFQTDGTGLRWEADWGQLILDINKDNDVALFARTTDPPAQVEI